MNRYRITVTAAGAPAYSITGIYPSAWAAIDDHMAAAGERGRVTARKLP